MKADLPLLPGAHSITLYCVFITFMMSLHGLALHAPVSRTHLCRIPRPYQWSQHQQATRTWTQGSMGALLNSTVCHPPPHLESRLLGKGLSLHVHSAASWDLWHLVLVLCPFSGYRRTLQQLHPPTEPWDKACNSSPMDCS